MTKEWGISEIIADPLGAREEINRLRLRLKCQALHCEGPAEFCRSCYEDGVRQCCEDEKKRLRSWLRSLGWEYNAERDSLVKIPGAADEPRAYADVKPFPFDPTAGADASNPYGKIVLTGPNGESIRLYLADRVDAALAVRLAGPEGCTK